MTLRRRRSPIVTYVLQFVEAAARAVAALALASLCTILMIRLIGGNIHLALWSLWDGAFGSPYNIGNTLVATTPLLLTGLGIALAFQCKIWNIGGEGQFLVGSLACSALAVNCRWISALPSVVLLPIILLASTLAGAAWAGIAAALKTWRNVPEVISTIMLNFIAMNLLSYLVNMVNGPMERPDHSQPATEMLASKATLPLLSQLAPSVFTPSPLHVGFLIAIIMAVIVFVVMYWTSFGFAVKLVGANVDAAKLAGIKVNTTLVIAMLCSGGLCGLAGGVELCGRVGFIPDGWSPGVGFQAIAVALLGRLSPVGVLFSSIFIGALSVGCQNMERNAGVNHQVGYIIQALALLALLATQWSGWSSLFPFQKMKSASA